MKPVSPLAEPKPNQYLNLFSMKLTEAYLVIGRTKDLKCQL